MTDTDTRQFTLTAPDGMIIAHGSMSAVTEHIVDSVARADAEDLLLEAAHAVGQLEALEEREQSAHAADVRRLCDDLTRFGRRLDAFEAKRKAQRKADAELEQLKIQNMLDQLPSPDEAPPIRPSPATKPSNDNGELTILHKPEPKGFDPEQDDAGLEGVTASRPTPDPEDLGYQPPPGQVPQPVAVQLNEDGV
jgi:hypothetical protein